MIKDNSIILSLAQRPNYVPILKYAYAYLYTQSPLDLRLLYKKGCETKVYFNGYIRSIIPL